MILTYKYRIKDRSARKSLRQHAWAVNQVWNWCVAHHRDGEARYRAGAPNRKWPSHFDLVRLCKGAGPELGIRQQTVQCVAAQFARNRDAAKRCPRFRASAGSRCALGWVPFQKYSRRIDDNSVIYCGRRYRFWEGRRPLPDTAKGGAFVEDARGRWYVIFHVEVSEHRPTGTATIGIDLGLKSLAACSDGRVIEAPRYYRNHEKRLAVAQRAGNKRRTKAIHAKISNCRRDFIHKATTTIARDSALIAIGNVNSSELARTRMAKSVLDASWSMFRAQLRYKASRHGAVFLEIDERFTTQVCSSCRAIPGSSPKGMDALGIRAWECSDCGAIHDRDVNAARNILALALSAQRLDGESRCVNRIGPQPSMTHRPAETAS